MTLYKLISICFTIDESNEVKISREVMWCQGYFLKIALGARLFSNQSSLVSEPNYYATKSFSDNILAAKNKRTKIFMNKPVCLGLSLLEISKVVMCEL